MLRHLPDLNTRLADYEVKRQLVASHFFKNRKDGLVTGIYMLFSDEEKEERSAYELVSSYECHKLQVRRQIHDKMMDRSAVYGDPPETMETALDTDLMGLMSSNTPASLLCTYELHHVKRFIKNTKEEFDFDDIYARLREDDGKVVPVALFAPTVFDMMEECVDIIYESILRYGYWCERGMEIDPASSDWKRAVARHLDDYLHRYRNAVTLATLHYDLAENWLLNPDEVEVCVTTNPSAAFTSLQRVSEAYRVCSDTDALQKIQRECSVYVFEDWMFVEPFLSCFRTDIKKRAAELLLAICLDPPTDD